MSAKANVLIFTLILAVYCREDMRMYCADPPTEIQKTNPKGNSQDKENIIDCQEYTPPVIGFTMDNSAMFFRNEKIACYYGTLDHYYKLELCNIPDGAVVDCMDNVDPVCAVSSDLTSYYEARNSCYGCATGPNKYRYFYKGPCPIFKTHFCTEEDRKRSCQDIMYSAPVCGRGDDGHYQDFKNECLACADPSVDLYFTGKCH